MVEIESTDYHDFVIKEGKLIGEFEQMYQKSATIPWHQDEQEGWIDVQFARTLISKFAMNMTNIIDLGCGLGYYLDLLINSSKGTAREQQGNSKGTCRDLVLI